MLSILIPVFNFEVAPLVKDLDDQCRECGIPYEIYCLDDGSQLTFKTQNRKLGQMERVRYSENKHNLGRSAIRNKLAREARYPYLFFLDCDSGVNDQFHIRKYVDRLDPQQVLYGGRIYQMQAPAQPELILHWHYGKVREQKNAAERATQPYHSFMSNNFLIPKALFDTIRFDESLTQYGHEDTLFGLELKKKQIPILHLDNPLLHLGLEEHLKFLAKNKMALFNLVQIYQQTSILETRLLKYYFRLQRFRMLHLFRFIYRIFQHPIQKNLTSSHPSLLLFDLFKIGELLRLSTPAK